MVVSLQRRQQGQVYWPSALRGVWGRVCCLSGQARAQVLLQRLRRPSRALGQQSTIQRQGAREPSLEGRQDGSAGIRPRLDARSPLDCGPWHKTQVRARASTRHGAGARSIVAASRAGTSQERRYTGQSPRKPRTLGCRAPSRSAREGEDATLPYVHVLQALASRPLPVALP